MSRLVGRLREDFETWRARDLADEDVRYVFMDGWCPKVRMRLLRIPEPFDHREGVFEVKMDGFRALAHIERTQCQLISRNGHIFKPWPQLGEEIADARARSTILDDEIVCLDADGRSNFNNLLFRRQSPFFYAFGLLMLDGRDLRELPLIERKRRLRRIMPSGDSRVLLMEHIEGCGGDLFRAACERDLEGIVGKWRYGRYIFEGNPTSWLKIKNAAYSQMDDRHELFQVRRSAFGVRVKAARPELALR